ncbi:hypothetical protein ACFQMA_02880 [Halosimplex aquaticum]|uniref:PEP-CTERM protein-sorting domain-containing protein n=1 Tax=Halosimplex aquaticum TaxID=3026162 RepID=A0ABD5XW20_9EURY|nr:hypothetical protein [Halosimplex aquaticum]
MDRLMGYGLTGTIGISGSTIASAIVGDPFPVVVPAIAAGAVIAGHHLRERRADRDAAGVEDDQDDDPLGMREEMDA